MNVKQNPDNILQPQAEKSPEMIREMIGEDSRVVDNRFVGAKPENFRDYALSLPIPPHHARASVIKETEFSVGNIEKENFPESSFYLIDGALENMFSANASFKGASFVTADEATLKEISWLDNFIRNESALAQHATVVGIGGGILLNAAAYIAEKAGVDFISVPTTVLAAADSAIGGLVRINKIDGGEYVKSFYKSVYEPSKIVVDAQLLGSLPKEQISFGLSEVIKHGVFQSRPLLECLASDEFNPFDNIDSLLKVVCWTAELKNIAIIHDPDSKGAGGDILRGSHKGALKIEEESHFSISHGQAVAVAIYEDYRNNPEIVSLLDKIYEKLGLPKT